MYSRAILHLDLDAFFVSVECLKNSALSGKPVIIGGTQGKGVVAACSYEARKFGIHSAMPSRMAKQLCPDAIFLRGDMECYTRYSRLVTEVIASEAPSFEKASIDEFYLDLSGMDRHIGCFRWSRNLRKKVIKESGLPISFGLSVNKLVSKVATGEAKPNNALRISNGTEKAFMAPLPISKIPGIGKVTYKKLAFMGIKTIKTLSEIPRNLLQQEFGKYGTALWKKANAIDNSPVIPYIEKKSISTERTFHVDSIDMTKLRSQITTMVTKLAFELRQSSKLTSCITLKIRYTDFNTYTRQKRIAHTANDQTLLDTALILFEKLYERRQLLRLVGVRFSGLVYGNLQINLFENTIKEVSLLTQMDRIRKRFGTNAIRRAGEL